MRAMAVMVVLAAAVARGQEPKDPFQGLRHGEELFRGAQLTGDQMGQLLQIRLSSWDREQQLAQESETAWRAFKEAFTSTEKLDAGKLGALAQRATEVDAQLQQFKMELLWRYRGVLTEQQLASVNESWQTLQRLREEERALPPAVAGAP